jgi:hypothetical protein
MTQHQRVTFTQGREVIEHSIRYLTRIRDALDALHEGDHGERVKMLLNSVEADQRNLLGSIERLLEDSSDKVLDTYAQYTVELPGAIEPAEQPLTTLGLIQWLERSNRPLQKMFAQLAQKGDNAEAGDVFGGIARQVEEHDKRLSKEYQRTEDL